MIDAQKRLDTFMAKGGISFSYGVEEGMHMITITKIKGSDHDSVGGSFESFDEGINYCIDYLEKVSRKRTIKSVRKI